MSTANLTPEQQQVLSLIQTFENTGGSQGYLRHLEAAQSTTQNAPQVDKNEVGAIYVPLNINIVPGEGLLKGLFFITLTTKPDSGLDGAPVYQSKGYGFANGAIITEPFSRSSLLLTVAWDTLLKAKEIPFKWKVPVQLTEEPLVDWEGFIDGSPVLSFGGFTPGGAGLENSYGVLGPWEELIPN